MVNDYYFLKRNEGYLFTLMAVFSLIISLICAFMYTFTESRTFHFLFAFFFFIYCIILVLSRSTQKTINKAIIFYSVISFYLGLLLIWMFDYPFYGFQITDNKMLVFVTILYVILTYMIMRSHFSIYQYQRMPQLSIDVKNDFKRKFIFDVKNISNHPAADVLITFEIVHPIPKNMRSALYLFFQRKYNRLVNVFQNKKSTYIIRHFSEYLETNDLKSINIEEEIQSLVDKKAKSHGLDVIGEEFQIILNYDYKSVDNLNLEVPFLKLFKFRVEPNGIHLVHKSGNFKKLT